MNKFILLMLLTLPLWCCAAPCTINSGKSPAETGAAEILKEFLGKLTSGSMEVSVGKENQVTFQIALDPTLSKDKECWKISTSGNVITLSGSNARSVYYAVSHFLEDFCGVFFVTPFEQIVPAKKQLTLPEINAQGSPYFFYRHIYRGSSRKDDKGKFAVMRRLNNDDTGRIYPQFGGVVGFGPPRFVHTMWSYVPQEKFFAAHPEYYALVNGKRRPGRESQLCFSNPDLPSVIYDQLVRYIEQGDRSCAGRKTARLLFYDISINDNGNFCRCEKCLELIRKHGHSGAMLYMLNPVAEKLGKSHPEIMITTLAYSFTSDVPKDILPAENIIIRLCPRINQAASIHAPENREFVKQVKGWSKVCKNLFIWDYAETYIKGGSGMPFASELYYADRYRFYADNGVKGIMWEHPFEPEADMYELKFYLETKLLEDPYADVAALTAKFMDAYYGKAAKDILEARKILDSSRKRSNAYIRFMSTPDEFQFSTAAELRAMQACFDRAEKAVAGDELLFARVRRARRGIDRICVFRALPPALRKAESSASYDRELAQQSMARLQQSWIKYLERYPQKEEYIAAARHEMAQYEMVLKGTGKAPARFAGMEIYDWPAARFQNHDLKAIKIVADPESEAGYAAKITVAANPKMYDPPFVMGFRDRGANVTYPVKLTAFPQKPGYHWYKLGTFTLPATADVFLSRSWCIKLHLAKIPERRPLEFWVSLKFTGPAFRKGDKGENAIYADRIIAIPQNVNHK